MPNAARTDCMLRTLAHLPAAQTNAKAEASKRANLFQLKKQTNRLWDSQKHFSIRQLTFLTKIG